MLLPIQDSEDFKGHSRAAHVALAAQYFRRMLRFRHMDFDHTLWLMLNLCAARPLKLIGQALPSLAQPARSDHRPSAACPRRCVNPRHVYRSATYHRGTKNMWARDDPAFVVLLLYLLLVSVVAWSIGFGRCNPRPLLSWARLRALQPKSPAWTEGQLRLMRSVRRHIRCDSRHPFRPRAHPPFRRQPTVPPAPAAQLLSPLLPLPRPVRPARRLRAHRRRARHAMLVDGQHAPPPQRGKQTTSAGQNRIAGVWLLGGGEREG